MLIDPGMLRMIMGGNEDQWLIEMRIRRMMVGDGIMVDDRDGVMGK